ncbi:hypothetical protein [Bradyrhizobium sp. Cp5.3]|nr:hypothetical protein [Bradyrhizobium sp. Cp5.3]
MHFLFVIPGRDEVANPESIHPQALLPDGFSDAQLRIKARATRAPE